MTAYEKEFGKRMDCSSDKKEIINYINVVNFNKVLDLGAGTCSIDYEFRDSVEVYCVDNNFKAELDRSKPNMHFIESGILEFVNTCTEDFDCVILSAVLHELSSSEIYRISLFLKNHLKGHCAIIIREPYYQRAYGYSNVLPYKSYEVMIETNCKIISKYPNEFREFCEASKKHPHYYSIDPMTENTLNALGFAFTMAYGKESWEREKHEYRFTFNLEELLFFCNDIMPCSIKKVRETYDESYRKHLANVGLDFVSDAIYYTNAMIIAEGFRD